MAKKFIPGQLGLFKPTTDWVRPSELPDLRGRPLVAIDTEGKDDGLRNGLGPGWALGMNQVFGVSYAAEGVKGYAPIRHPDSDNFPAEQVFRWVDDLFKSGTRIVFHNGPYDIGSLGSEGVSTPVNFDDTSVAAVMDDENHRSYSLDACLLREGLPPKNKEMMQQAISAMGGDPKKGAADLYLLPAEFAGEYAEDDAALTLELWKKLEPRLKADGVWDAYRLEIDLIPITIAMRRRGIRVDVDRAERAAAALRQRVEILLDVATDRLSDIQRRRVTVEDLRSPVWLARAFTNFGLSFPRTPKTGQGSFSAEWMSKSDHWLPKLVVDARHYEDAASKQIENFLLGFVHRGRIHAEIHQFKTDEGGTRSQRFSYGSPPLQQMEGVEEGKDDKPIPAGDKPWEFYGGVGGEIRACLLPERDTAWGAFDYSSQEPRLTIHFGAVTNCPGIEDIIQTYQDNPRTDYHQMVADMTGRPRKPSKILNLAMTYGKGKRATALELGVSMEEAETLIKNYHQRLPYIGPLDQKCKNAAATRGYIRLIDGARMHYNLWEGPYLDEADRIAASRAGFRLEPCDREEALRRQRQDGHPWSQGQLRRADTRKALNNLVQGSAARQTKRAIKMTYDAGYLPLIQMHDEQGVPVTSQRDVDIINQIMVEAIPLKVPTVVDCEIGPTWGDAKYSWAEYEEKFK